MLKLKREDAESERPGGGVEGFTIWTEILEGGTSRVCILFPDILISSPSFRMPPGIEAYKRRSPAIRVVWHDWRQDYAVMEVPSVPDVSKLISLRSRRLIRLTPRPLIRERISSRLEVMAYTTPDRRSLWWLPVRSHERARAAHSKRWPSVDFRRLPSRSGPEMVLGFSRAVPSMLLFAATTWTESS